VGFVEVTAACAFISGEKTKWSDNSNHRFLKSHASKFIIMSLLMQTLRDDKTPPSHPGLCSRVDLCPANRARCCDRDAGRAPNLPQDGNDTNLYTAPCSMGVGNRSIHLKL
jgi:hypothetical protein